MAWQWLNKIIRRIAAEVHKSKIEEFEKRILAVEQMHEVILKTIKDSEAKLDKLDNRIYDAILDSAKVIGTIETLKELGIRKQELLTKENKQSEQANNKRARVINSKN